MAIRGDIQLARDEYGKECWYAWIDINGNTFRSDLLDKEEWAKEMLTESLQELKRLQGELSPVENHVIVNPGLGWCRGGEAANNSPHSFQQRNT